MKCKQDILRSSLKVAFHCITFVFFTLVEALSLLIISFIMEKISVNGSLVIKFEFKINFANA